MMNKIKIIYDFSFDQPTALGVSFSKDAIEKAIQNSADVPILLYEGCNNAPRIVGHGKFAKVLKVDEHNQIISAQLDAILYSFDVGIRINKRDGNEVKDFSIQECSVAKEPPVGGEL